MYSSDIVYVSGRSIVVDAVEIEGPANIVHQNPSVSAASPEADCAHQAPGQDYKLHCSGQKAQVGVWNT